MAAGPAPARAQSTVRERSDDSSLARPRTWAFDVEVLELVEAAHQRLKPGTRFYLNSLGNHVVNAYGELRKWSAQTPADGGRWKVSLLHITRNLYDVVGASPKVQDNKSRQLRSSWLPLLREAGLVAYSTALDAAGRPVGITFELLPVEAAYAAVGSGARRDSSVGGAHAAECEYRRRQETRKERQAARVRPWCRRSGQTKAKGVLGPSHARYERVEGGTAKARPVFRSRRDFTGPGLNPPNGTTSLVGGVEQKEEWLCVRDALRSRGLSDTSQRPWWISRLAALEIELAAPASREAGAEALAVAVADGVPVEDAVCAAWRAVWGSPPLMSRRAVLELRNARRMLERCSTLPGPAGGDRATAWLVGDLIDYAEDHRAGRSQARHVPGSVAFFIRRLRHVARQERRAWRHRRGDRRAQAASS